VKRIEVDWFLQIMEVRLPIELLPIACDHDWILIFE